MREANSLPHPSPDWSPNIYLEHRWPKIFATWWIFSYIAYTPRGAKTLRANFVACFQIYLHKCHRNYVNRGMAKHEGDDERGLYEEIYYSDFTLTTTPGGWRSARRCCRRCRCRCCCCWGRNCYRCWGRGIGRWAAIAKDGRTRYIAFRLQLYCRWSYKANCH